MRPGRNDETQVTFDADQLASQLQLLDALHSAASEERLPQLTALPEEGLKAWLAEMQYLAGETLAEIERNAARKTAAANCASCAAFYGQSGADLRYSICPTHCLGEARDRTTMINGRVLLLNGSSWEPLAVIGVPRAINLLLAGKAITVEQSGRFLRTVSSRFAVPSVIALRTFVNVPRRRAHWSRKGVLIRDNYTCIYCGARPGSLQKGQVLGRNDLTIDHVLPRSRGGRDQWTNTACACTACNHRKGNRLPHEAGMRMRSEPRTPRTSYLVIAVSRGQDSWKQYIEF